MSFLIPFAAPFLVNAVVNVLASAVLSRLFSSKSKTSRATPSTTRVSEMVRSPMTPRRWVYGRAVTGGCIVFSHVVPGAPPFDDVMHLVVVWADGRSDALEQVYFNDEPIGEQDEFGNIIEGRFVGTQVRTYLGDQTSADATLIAELPSLWTQEHILRDTTYSIFRMQFSDAAYSSGLPNISARLRGRQVYDPRSGLTAWSDNWALCVRDYLLDPDGCGCSSDEIDEAVLIASATVCDESIPLAAGGTEQRYRLNGSVDLTQAPADILPVLAAAGGGAIVWSGGAWRVHSGQWDPPVWDLDADDLRGPVDVQFSVSRRELANTLRGSFSDLTTRQIVSIPEVAPATWRDDDGGEAIVVERSWPMTTSSATAQRLAKLELSRLRAAPRVVLPAKLTVVAVQPWDVVRLSIDHLGWAGTTFRVVDWTLDPDSGGIDLVLRAESETLYEWDAEEEPIVAGPSTGLPASSSVAPPGTPEVVESLYETTGSAGVKARATVSWDASAGPFLDRYETTFGARSQMVPADITSVQWDDIEPGTYGVAVRARNSIGIASAWAEASVTVSGLAAPPAAVTGLSLLSTSGVAHAVWTAHPDLDVRIGGRIEFRWSPATTGATWADAVQVGDAPGSANATILPLRTGTYLAKARDSSGSYSTTAASFLATEALVTGWTTVDTLTQATGFTGTKTGLAVASSKLQFAASTNWDSLAGNVDSLAGDMDALGGLTGTGTYEFAAYSDLTTSAARRLELEIAVAASDASTTLDQRQGNVDDWPGLWDGDVVEGWNVQTCYATTEDDPAGTPTWSDWVPFVVADAAGRGYKFKSEFVAGAPLQQIQVSTLTVTIREPA